MPRNNSDFQSAAGVSPAAGFVYNGASWDKDSPVVPAIKLTGHSLQTISNRGGLVASCGSNCGWTAQADNAKHARWLHDNHKAHVAGVPGPSFWQPDGNPVANGTKYMRKSSDAQLFAPNED